MFAYLLLILVLFSSSLNAQSSPLEPEKTVSNKISGNTTESFEINLAEGDFACVVVEQMNVDVVIKLNGVDGKQILVFDQENKKSRSRAVWLFLLDQSGKYRIEIQPTLKNAQGQYAIYLEKIRTAASDDRLIFKARQNLYQSSRIAEEENNDDALPIAEESSACFRRNLGQGKFRLCTGPEHTCKYSHQKRRI